MTEQETDREVLIKYYNVFHDRLIAANLDLEHYLDIEEKFPDCLIPLPNGQKVNVCELVKQTKENISRAKKYLKVINRYLKAKNKIDW